MIFLKRISRNCEGNVEYLSKENLKDLVEYCYLRQMSLKETFKFIENSFMLSKEDKELCEDIWEHCLMVSSLN